MRMREGELRLRGVLWRHWLETKNFEGAEAEAWRINLLMPGARDAMLLRLVTMAIGKNE